MYLSTTSSPWTLHNFIAVEIHLCLTPPFLHTLPWYFSFTAEVVLRVNPHFLGTEDKRVNKMGKGTQRDLFLLHITLNLWLWAPSRNVVNEMISIHSIWLLSYSFLPPPLKFFKNSLHSFHCWLWMLLLEWEL